MCGIAGYLFITKEETTNSCEMLQAMSARIAHRGPDDEGFLFIDTFSPDRKYARCASSISQRETQEQINVLEPSSFRFPHNLAMAHRRFSIIDLSPSGHQPMWNKDCSLCVTFNGEIFNYIELREELVAADVVFYTGSDTEVILAAYEKWGKGAFKRFSGFWAIALYDRAQNSLILCRDRIGKKPLYVYSDSRGVIWSSEIKSILEAVPQQRECFKSSYIYNYLLNGKKDIAHTTFWKNIQMMGNACWMEFEVSTGGAVKLKTGRYWDIPSSRMKESEIDIDTALKRTRELLELSLSERLRADVPIAFELSGGMDSSSLVALRSVIKKDPFRAFTIQYPDKKEDESFYAVRLAKRFPNIEHRLIPFQEQNLWEHMNDFQYLMEEPFHNPNLLVNQLLRRRMRQEGYKVLVSGSGGDEVTAGYTEYAVPLVKELVKNHRYMEAAWNVLLYSEKYPLRFKPMMRILWNKYFKKPSPSISFENYMKEKIDPSPLFEVPKDIDRLLIANMKDLKMFYWMSSGDKSTMGIPVEARAPFLDYRFVEFLFSLPVSYLMRRGWLKWLVRESLKDILPPEVRFRKEKMGFPFPLQQWLASNETIIKGLLTRFENPWVDNKRTVRDYELLNRQNPAFLWRCINVQLWYTRFVCGEIPTFL